MSAHTQGRLVVGQYRVNEISRHSDFHGVAVEDETLTIAVTGPTGAVDSIQAAADARRLAACWNACQFMQTEDIEAYGEAVAGVVGPIGKGHIALAAERDQLRADLAACVQRNDELIAHGQAKAFELAAAMALLTEVHSFISTGAPIDSVACHTLSQLGARVGQFLKDGAQ